MKNSVENEKIIDRLREYLSIKKITEHQLTQTCGLSVSVLWQAKQPNRDLGRKTINKIAEFYPDLNLKWLVAGTGNMLNSDNSNVSDPDINLVSIYNLDVAAGMNTPVNEIDNEEYIIKRIPFDGTLPGDIGFVVTGNSMFPKYSAGSIVVAREVQNWQEFFGFGNTFVLLLNDGRRILKKILKSCEDKNNVLAASFNPDFPAEELPKKMILKVYKVIASFQQEGF